MPPDPICPAADVLEQFLLGKLSGPESEQVEAHLTHCPACVESLNAVRAVDPLVEVVRQSGDGSTLPQSPVVRDLVERISGLQNTDPYIDRDPASTASHLPPPQFSFLRPAEGPDAIGRLGSYRVLRLLGEGGMGVVFEAWDEHLNRNIALKVIKPGSASSPEAQQHFLREGRSIAALQHDHVIPVYQYGEDRGVLFLVMPVLKGETLADRMRREGRPSVDEVVRLGREVAEGLAAAHSAGIIHRDIKPGNLWLEGPPEDPSAWRRVKILDFGLARLVEDGAEASAHSRLAGTPAYMSPEQAAGSELDERSDLFSIGCVLYEMLTGRQPFPGATALAVLAQLTGHEPPPPRAVNKDVPQRLSDLVVRLLAKEAAQRPASAAAVASELAALQKQLAQREVFGRRKSSHHLHLRRRTLAAVGLAVLLVGLAAGWVGILVKLQTPDLAKVVIALPPPTAPTRVSPVPPPPVVQPRTGLDSLHQGDIPPEDLEAVRWKGKVPEELVAVLGGTRLKHADVVLGLAYSPDGRLLASAGRDGQVVVWDPRDGQRRHTLELPGPASAVAFTPDGQQLLAKGSDGTAYVWKVWDQGLQKPPRTLPFFAAPGMHPGRGQLAFSPVHGSKRVALVDSGGKVQVYNWESWTKDRDWPTFSPRDNGAGAVCLAFAPDGKYRGCLATWEVGEKRVRLWDPQDHTAKDLPFEASAGDRVLPREGLAFDRQGRLLAASAGDKAWVLDLAAGRVTKLPAGEACSLAFSADGQQLALGGWEEVQFWDVKERTKRDMWAGVGRWEVFDLAFSPDGKTLAAAGTDPAIHLLSLAKAREVPALAEPMGSGRAVLGLPGNGFLYAEDRKRIHSWKPGDAAPSVAPFQSQLARVRCAASQAGGWLAVLGGEKPGEKGGVEVYAGQPLHRLHEFALPAPVTAVAVSPDGPLLAAACWDDGKNTGHVVLWNSATQVEVARLGPLTKQVFSLAFRPGGTQVAGAGEDLLVRVWDTRNGKQVFDFRATKADLVVGLAYSPDGKYLATTGGSESKNEAGYLRKGDVCLWDADSGRAVRTLLERGNDQRGGVDLAFSPRGDRLAWSCQDGVIRIWDLPGGELRKQIRLGPESCQAAGLAFSADGRHLLAAYRNGTVCVLRLAARP
jgi:serine/threonine protein kinase/WD40 repeat protein